MVDNEADKARKGGGAGGEGAEGEKEEKEEEHQQKLRKAGRDLKRRTNCSVKVVAKFSSLARNFLLSALLEAL